ISQSIFARAKLAPFGKGSRRGLSQDPGRWLASTMVDVHLFTALFLIMFVCIALCHRGGRRSIDPRLDSPACPDEKWTCPVSGSEPGMKIVVTGGSGQLGRHVVQTFSALGHDILSIDRVADPSARLSWVCDLGRTGDLYEAFAGADAIVH